MPKPLAVLLMAMGGPDCLENVEPFLLDVRGGRPTSPELVAEIRERYRATGGKSPAVGITMNVATKSTAAFAARAGSLVGTAARVERIIPVLYSPVTTSTVPANEKHLDGDFSDLLLLPSGAGPNTPPGHHQYQIFDPLTTALPLVPWT